VEATARPASVGWTGAPAPPMASRANVRPLTTAAACPCSPAPSATPAHRTGPVPRRLGTASQPAAARRRHQRAGRVRPARPDRGGKPEQMTDAAAAAYLALTLDGTSPGTAWSSAGPWMPTREPGSAAWPTDTSCSTPTRMPIWATRSPTMPPRAEPWPPGWCLYRLWWGRVLLRRHDHPDRRL